MFSFFANASHPVYLLWIIDKTSVDTLTDAQERQFKRMTTLLKSECE